MAMSKRSGEGEQEEIWVAHRELAREPGHPFYERLNEVIESAGFDEFVEGKCARFYHARLGLRRFLGIGLAQGTPDHSTISRTRRLIDIDTHRAVFSWVLGVLGSADC
jgi:transposase